MLTLYSQLLGREYLWFRGLDHSTRLIMCLWPRTMMEELWALGTECWACVMTRLVYACRMEEQIRRKLHVVVGSYVSLLPKNSDRDLERSSNMDKAVLDEWSDKASVSLMDGTGLVIEHLYEFFTLSTWDFMHCVQKVGLSGIKWLSRLFLECRRFSSSCRLPSYGLVQTLNAVKTLLGEDQLCWIDLTVLGLRK